MDSTSAFELARTDAIGQAALAANGELTATELLDAAIVRVEATRGLNAVITDLFDRGRSQAAALDRPGAAHRAGRSAGGRAVPAQGSGSRPRWAPRKPWAHGRYATMSQRNPPWTVEQVSGCRTRRLRQDQHPRVGQPLHHRAVAVRRHGEPVVPDRHPGGSSGGSAAAVAAGVVPAASGGDGTGSIRVPGLKVLRRRRSQTAARAVVLLPDGGHGLEGLVNESRPHPHRARLRGSAGRHRGNRTR